jgi:hypothetical protein
MHGAQYLVSGPITTAIPSHDLPSYISLSARKSSRTSGKMKKRDQRFGFKELAGRQTVRLSDSQTVGQSDCWTVRLLDNRAMEYWSGIASPWRRAQRGDSSTSTISLLASNPELVSMSEKVKIMSRPFSRDSSGWK